MQEASASYLRRLGIVVEETEDLEATIDILRRYITAFRLFMTVSYMHRDQWQPITTCGLCIFLYLGPFNAVDSKDVSLVEPSVTITKFSFHLFGGSG